MNRIKVAIHLHTHYSHDSNMSPAALVAAACRQGIDCLAVTDHNSIEGALQAKNSGEIRVIIGEEISSTDGHLIGLFLKEAIPPKLSGIETCAAIHEQGGLALAPHPFCILCENSLQSSVHALLDQLDAIEVYNAQNPLPWEDRRAGKLALRTGLPGYVGMDAHLRWLPLAYQRMDDFKTPPDFLRSLKKANLYKARVGFRYYCLMGLRHLWDKFFPRPLPGFGIKTPLPIIPQNKPALPAVVKPTRTG